MKNMEIKYWTSLTQVAVNCGVREKYMNFLFYAIIIFFIFVFISITYVIKSDFMP